MLHIRAGPLGESYPWNPAYESETDFAFDMLESLITRIQGGVSTGGFRLRALYGLVLL